MSAFKRIGHAVLHVSDVERSRNWYQEMLGMEVVVEAPRMRGCFLSFGEHDHDIALFEAPGAEHHGRREYNHLAFELEGGAPALRAFRRRLEAANVTIQGIVDHGVSYGIYFLDPDGHCLEAFVSRVPEDADAKALFREVGVLARPVNLDALE